jgi:hypothetical protein
MIFHKVGINPTHPLSNIVFGLLSVSHDDKTIAQIIPGLPIQLLVCSHKVIGFEQLNKLIAGVHQSYVGICPDDKLETFI